MSILISSTSADLLGQTAADIADFLRRHPRLTPADVAGHLAAVRPTARWRAALHANTHDDFLAALDAIAHGGSHHSCVVGREPARVRRKVFVFPGQGSQRIGMGARFYESSSDYAAVVDECQALLQSQFQLAEVRDYLLGSGNPTDEVRIVQPALCVHMLGLAALWRGKGVEPEAVVGHSQGEIAAAYVSGVVNLSDALTVVVARSRLAAHCDDAAYAMAFLALSAEDCRRLLAHQPGWAELSVVNAPSGVCVSGFQDSVQGIVQQAHHEGIYARVIEVHYPAHTSRIAHLAGPLTEHLRDTATAFADSTTRCYSPALHGSPIAAGSSTATHWFLNLRNTVRFDLAVAAAAADGFDLFIEMAEHPTLVSAIDETLADNRAHLTVSTSRRDDPGMAEFDRALATVRCHDAELDIPRPATSRPLPGFPHTRFATQRYWAPPATTPAPEPAPIPSRTTAPPRRLQETWETLTHRELLAPQKLHVVAVESDHRIYDALTSAAEHYGASLDSCAPDTLVAVLSPKSIDYDAKSLAAQIDWLSDQIDCTAATTLLLVTTHGESVAGEIPNPLHASLTATTRCLAADAGIAFRHVDLDNDTDAAATTIIAAVHTAGEAELAQRGDLLCAKRIAEATLATDYGDLRNVLITGTGPVALAVATELADRGAQHITLVNRRGESDAIRSHLDPARRQCPIDVVGADITDVPAVVTLSDTCGPVTALIHTAVDYIHSERPSVAEITRSTAAKVGALDVLVEHLRLTDSARVILFSSVSATFGGRGLAAYALANRLLDATSFRLRAQGIHCSSIQWGLWDADASEVRAGHDAIASGATATGYLPMDPALAIGAGMTGDGSNSIVLSADWQSLQQVCEIHGSPRLFTISDHTPAPTRPLAREQSPAVIDLVASVMQLSVTADTDWDAPLVALGLDSLQAIELHRAFTARSLPIVPVTELLHGATLNDVVAYEIPTAAATPDIGRPH